MEKKYTPAEKMLFSAAYDATIRRPQELTSEQRKFLAFVALRLDTFFLEDMDRETFVDVFLPHGGDYKLFNKTLRYAQHKLKAVSAGDKELKGKDMKKYIRTWNSAIETAVEMGIKK